MGPLLLVLCAALWGVAFVAQKAGADHLGPFAVLCSRSFIAGTFLLLCVVVRRRFSVRGCAGGAFSRPALLGGAVCGLALFLAQLAQQVGIAETTPGICAFLTSNYVLLVPVFGLAVGRRAGLPAWGGVLLALLGTYLICVAGERFAVGFGEACTLACAALFAVQILLVDRFAPGTDVFAFSCVQQFSCGFASLPFLALPSERICLDVASLSAALLPVLFLGVVSSGIAYTLQNLGQVRTPPALAAIVMSLESVFGALAGRFLCGDVLTPRQLAGCALVFCAVVGSQLCEMLSPSPRTRNLQDKENDR